VLVGVAAGLAVLAVFIGGNAVLVLRTTARAAGENLIRLPEGEMRVVESGPSDGRAVVLIHGTAGSAAWWDPVVPALQDLRVVRIELLGHGGSAKPTSGYEIPQQADHVAKVLDHLGVRTAVIVGHSTGGSVATALAEKRKDLVSALALIDTGPSADAFLAQPLTSRLLPNPAIGPVLWRLRSDDVIRAGLQTAFTRPIDIPGTIIDAIRGMTYRSLNGTTKAAKRYLEARPLPARLSALGLPVQVIFGTKDRRWRPSSFEDYRAVPGIRIERLDGVGHTPMLEDPGRTGELLRRFVVGDTC
jgi:pimeloyl-ACP methyl ester carboxylesterase